MELISKIQSIPIPSGAKLVSFDVTNMYSNIPVGETLKIVGDLLQKNKVEPKYIAEVTDLLKIISQQNYFVHNNEFFTQCDGLPTGSPLSGTLANIYLNHIETTFILNSKNKLFNNIIYWHRYVDDIIILFKGSIRQLDQLHKYIDNIHSNIKFTMEIESDKSINFLDLTITNISNKHNFKIHRKSTQTSHTIHSTSHHPFQHKIAAFHHLLNRLHHVPMANNDFDDEYNTIMYIAHCNGYPHSIIDKINTKIKNKINLRNLSTLQYDAITKKYVSIEYNRTTCNIMKKVLHEYGYTVAFTTNNKMQRFVKMQPNKQQKESGIYMLTCNDCQKFYLGQTGRSFQIRFKEHVDELNNSHTKSLFKSNYAQHLFDDKHTYTDAHNNMHVLYRCEKGNTMDRLEELEIHLHRNNPLLLNDKLNTKTNQLYDFIATNYR